MDINLKLLIFIPTYNEINNVENILNEILAMNLNADILFLDDNSPDGTGSLLDSLADKQPCLSVIHRTGKLGIGSAHRDGILWAYKNGYRQIITLDCDATHPPKYIPDFIERAKSCDIVVGSRHINKLSLHDWSLKRKFLTKLGHWLTFYCLGIPYDATGAYRIYNLHKLPSSFLNKVRSQGYSFFFETLFVLHLNHYKVGEVAIHLPSRINDKSKMQYQDIYDSLRLLVVLFFEKLFHQKKFIIESEK
ncbi:glycosyltransferase [Polynucleobacter sp. es-GGE-1]|uniref:glycosyltransferase n=1 Tax=Polynucleobacter sp. es-GGE-1 TaxID=1819724 RepID=UPI001C0C556C|nr:glycosyltransferase [Polynucleobacter sp. es-GGE-1]MBU3635953.1 glycosyltransferase [Polynucleobacter sp. es-GGE-1]